VNAEDRARNDRDRECEDHVRPPSVRPCTAGDSIFMAGHVTAVAVSSMSPRAVTSW
jgi:hypothetical protein